MKDRSGIRNKQLDSYIRNHNGNNYAEMEKSKIEKEKVYSSKLSSKVKNKLKSINHQGILDTDLEELSAISHEVKKVRGNLKTHKTRYKSLFRDEN